MLAELRSADLYEQMRTRAKRRKSPWNALLIPLFPAGMVATWYGFLWVIVGARNLALPQHVASVGELMRSNCQGFLSVVCFAGSFFAAIPFGALVCNCILWCIPPVRRVFEREAKGHAHASFAEAQRDMFILARRVSLPVFLVALGAGMLMRCNCP